MSQQSRPRLTSMVICDICDNEIKRDADGSDGRANLMSGISPAPGTATNGTRHVILCWGRRRLIHQRPDPRPEVMYDFHGRCIADLVDAHVAQRTKATS